MAAWLNVVESLGVVVVVLGGAERHPSQSVRGVSHSVSVSSSGLFQKPQWGVHERTSMKEHLV